MVKLGKVDSMLKISVSKIAHWIVFGPQEFKASKEVRKEANDLHKDFGNKFGTIFPEKLHKRLRFLSRITGNIIVVGRLDGLRVEGNTVQLVEFKTVKGLEVWEKVIEVGSIQLQLYIWLVKPQLEQLGLSIAKVHSLEIISRETREVIEKIEVKEDPEIEAKIWSYVYEALDFP